MQIYKPSRTNSNSYFSLSFINLSPNRINSFLVAISVVSADNKGIKDIFIFPFSAIEDMSLCPVA